MTTNSEALGTAVHLPGKSEKVWVGVRVRPLLQHEVDAKETVAWRAADNCTLKCLAEDKGTASHQQKSVQQNAFLYDRVFADSCTSEEVYAAAAQPMVQSAMEGYNCTLFAYGQTGSGKTTTMRSVMQHAAKDIFAHISRTRDRDFVLRMCAIEVYNEVVHDLFVDTDTNLKINDDKEKGPVVVDLSEQNIESEEHLLKMLKAVEGRRQVRETKMNQKSSRSHLVVRLYVESRPALASDEDASSDDGSMASDDSSSGGGAGGSGAGVQAPRMSTINFVDLAGSERLTQASMTDDADKEKLRQKEASNINVSLLTLGKVIRALGAAASKRGGGGEHVPYRESNLTRILQPSLAGNSRMAIVCNLSPASGSVDNSRAALHFANHAKNVTMRPVVNEVRDEQALIHKMEVEIAELRRKLARMDRPERGSRKSGAKALLAEKDAELRAKEEAMQQALQERAALERKLGQMEKFIIRGGSGSPAQGLRRSFDGVDMNGLNASVAGLAGGAGGYGRGVSGALAGAAAGAAGMSVRASWNPTSTTSPLDGRANAASAANKLAAALGRSVAPPNRLLLDFWMLKPDVRKHLNKMEGTAGGAGGAAGTSPQLARGGGMVGASVAAGGSSFAFADALNAAAAGTQRQSCMPGLRTEIGKLQTPEGVKAQEALTALQAEVRAYSQQPAAAAAVAAAASATPDTADRWLGQLNEMLQTMEARQQQLAAEAAAAVAASGTGREAGDSAQVKDGGEDGADPADPLLQPPSDEDQAALMEYLRSEVARLQRMRAANEQTKQAMDSLASKVENLHEPASAVVAGAPDGAETAHAGAAEVLERLQTALEEADALEECDEEYEEDTATQDGRNPGSAGGRQSVPRRRRAGAAAGNGEATSSQRYDSPVATGHAATAGAVLPGASPAAGPHRLSGAKLPRAMLSDADGLDAAEGGAVLKSPRRGLMASPHGTPSAALTSTPNSKIPRPAGATMSASVGAMAHAALAHHGSDSPRGLADTADDMALRRMRTPSLSMQASDGEPGAARTASVSSRGALLRWDTDRAKRIISREKDAIHSWYAAEVSRLKAAFHKEAQADVEAMKEAVERYKGMFEETQERVERLNMQKQLLIKQVLQLELAVDEAEQRETKSAALIAQLTAERDQAQYEAVQAKGRAQAAFLQAQRAQAALQEAHASHRPLTPNEQHAFIDDDDDDWANAPTPEALLAQICELWHRLHVPLVYRSRFYLLFRNKELIYLSMEQRRLRHRLEQLQSESDLGMDYFVSRSKPLEKAKRALELERKVLAHAMRYSYNESQREELFEAWGVKPNSKGRKVQLVKKLWDPAFTQDQAGIEACAQVVCQLAGPDATEQFMQLVFGNTAEAVARPTPVGALMQTLVRRVTTPRQRSKGTPSAAPTASGATQANNPGMVTPRGASVGGMLSQLAGRVGSFLSRENAGGGRTPGLPPMAPQATPRGAPPPAPLAEGATPRHTPVGFASPPQGGPQGEMGPMTKNLAAGGGTPLPSARGPGPADRPPTYPSQAAGTPPASARGAPTYAAVPGRAGA
ncbi:hypothetical protein HXX76_008315 [Chlamydomonas incerta]|uniref:Kinesin motor domain-containing protein n=1 Tax=Chlamydomonas incerta TaxID=51695 RepID=A0A835SWV3_CHLIN|nr:hypothetical protein HXX76_008315 [Chlamydomonas incerta]|eukprot:KAG2433246.1 hypothetical protein HXX76_008315 [Chlamydomonas incerta]